MDESEVKPSKEEGKRPQASLGLKSKKERGNNENSTRVSTAMFIAPPKTPVASKLRKDAQAKALAAEKVVAASEGELLDEPECEDEHEVKIKKKKRTIEEEEEDDREMAILQAAWNMREQNRMEYEDEMLLVEDSEEEDEVIVPAFLGDVWRSKEG
jgi:DNA polymerase sigma